jgi:hypothetical protein
MRVPRLIATMLIPSNTERAVISWSLPHLFQRIQYANFEANVVGNGCLTASRRAGKGC